MGKIVDFSHHQGTVNWALASTELDLAIIRVQYGSSVIDQKYKEYVAGCKKYGVPFGHYAYCKFVSIQDAIVEAEDFDMRADKHARFLVADVEEQTTKRIADMAPATQAFIDTLKKKGWKVGLYSGHHTYQPFGMRNVKADFVWIPRYGTTPPIYPCDLWQYTETGRLSGVSGNVDLNRLTGTKPLSFFLEKSSNQEEEIPMVDAKMLQALIDQQQKQINALQAQLDKKAEKAQVGETPDSSHQAGWDWLKGTKLTDGQRPHDPLTREQFATILYRFYQKFIKTK